MVVFLFIIIFFYTLIKYNKEVFTCEHINGVYCWLCWKTMTPLPISHYLPELFLSSWFTPHHVYVYYTQQLECVLATKWYAKYYKSHNFRIERLLWVTREQHDYTVHSEERLTTRV